MRAQHYADCEIKDELVLWHERITLRDSMKHRFGSKNSSYLIHYLSTHLSAPPLNTIDRCIDKALGRWWTRAVMMTTRGAIATDISKRPKAIKARNSKASSPSYSKTSLQGFNWSLASMRPVTLHLLFSQPPLGLSSYTACIHPESVQAYA